MVRADTGKGTQGTHKKTASKASDKSEVELAFDAKRFQLNQIQKTIAEYPQKEAEFKLKREKESLKVEELRKLFEEAEEELAQTKKLSGAAKNQNAWSLFKLEKATKEFEEAGKAYTKENMRKFDVVDDGEEEDTHDCESDDLEPKPRGIQFCTSRSEREDIKE